MSVSIQEDEVKRALLAQIDPEILLADGFDDALIGVAERMGKPVAIYCRDACIRLLIERDCMTYHQAEEYFDFNVACSYVGERTPLFMWKPERRLG